MDAFITQNPQITLFKPLYRRHTDFKVIEESLQVRRIGENTYDAAFSEDTEIHLLNQIVLHHPDPDLNLEACLEKIEVVGCPIDNEYTFCEVSARQILFDSCDDVSEKVRFPCISRDESGICVRPFFFFSDPEKSLPLISLHEMKVWCRITSRVPFNVDVWGFKVQIDEKNRFLNNSHEYLVRLRTPFETVTKSHMSRDPSVVWMPKTHHRWGSDFNKRVLTLLGCIRKTFGVVERNLRIRIISEIALAETFPTKTFEIHLDLADSSLTVTDFIFIARDKAGVYHPNQARVMGVSIEDNGNVIAKISSRRLLDQNRRWSFRLNEDNNQPSGHLTLAWKKFVIRVVCDQRVECVEFMDFHYNVLRLFKGFGGYAFTEKGF